jgi:IS1 family transposase
MADIDVVPKHRSNVWLWIVLAVIAVAVVAWALSARSPSTGQLFQAEPEHLAHLNVVAQHFGNG